MWARQYGFKDSDVDYMLQCLKCKKKNTFTENEIECAETWNKLNI